MIPLKDDNGSMLVAVLRTLEALSRLGWVHCYWLNSVSQQCIAMWRSVPWLLINTSLRLQDVCQYRWPG